MYALLFFSIVLFKSNRVISWFMVSLMAFILMYLESDILVSRVLRGLSCFFGGAFTYVMYKKISQHQPSYVFGSLVEALLVVLVVLTVQSEFEYRPIIAPILFFFTVLFFAFESGVLSKLFKIKPLQYTGKLSYSIYMIHAVLFLYFGAIVKVIQKVTGIEMILIIEGVEYTNFGNEFINNISVLLIISIVIYMSSITYNYVEIYGQKLGKR